VSDAWIIAADDGPASETARAVAELGFRPLRMALDGRGDAGWENGTSRAPDVAIVLDSLEAVASLRRAEGLGDVPVVLTVEADQVEDLDAIIDVDELIVRPFGAGELRARIARARRQANGIAPDDIVRTGSLTIDLATYQVAVADEPIDFTYMEYELLKFLATHPNRVFSREALLSRVWGYDYYGGARTVDVHVRRVRAKLGAEHALRIKTVRSVGYRFEG
jgi:two-component system, OmpR family, alkaline phosphatase synthesis response regulator PhoP